MIADGFFEYVAETYIRGESGIKIGPREFCAVRLSQIAEVRIPSVESPRFALEFRLSGQEFFRRVWSADAVELATRLEMNPADLSKWAGA